MVTNLPTSQIGKKKNTNHFPIYKHQNYKNEANIFKRMISLEKKFNFPLAKNIDL